MNVTPDWTKKFEDFVHNLTPWNSEAPDQAGEAVANVSKRLKNTNIRVNTRSKNMQKALKVAFDAIKKVISSVMKVVGPICRRTAR
ncbi:hypothetical protein [Streptomyces sp. NBC_01618]|uniref:hypothetical protein n=1 Tax=Streptomyces sp. NBC_01618 TaxID=2975900 RepID=UPI00386650D4|nr:hypothetical protein OH735_22115 [Streptomyces sp. NBC_01618]